MPLGVLDANCFDYAVDLINSCLLLLLLYLELKDFLSNIEGEMLDGEFRLLSY